MIHVSVSSSNSGICQLDYARWVTEQMAEFYKDYNGPNLYSALLAVGESMPAPQASLPVLGEPRQCYRNAGRMAFGSPFRYVEGIATAGLDSGSNTSMPVEHAWLVDTDGQVVETTWAMPGYSYFGVAFEYDEYHRLSTEGGFWDVLPTLFGLERWR